MDTFNLVTENDFIYVDPPYIKEKSFREYGSNVFSPKDLEELVNKLNVLCKKIKFYSLILIFQM